MCNSILINLADDGTETDRDIKPDIMAIPVQAGYSATPTMSLSGLEPIAAASNTPDNQSRFEFKSAIICLLSPNALLKPFTVNADIILNAHTPSNMTGNPRLDNYLPHTGSSRIKM